MRLPILGHEVDYEQHGDGRPLLLVHGLAVDRRVLVEACEPVFVGREGWRRIYVDLPGHGASRGDPARASADDLVETLAELLRSVAPERPCVLGYSYGGYLAQGLVRELPELDGMFLCCPTVEPDVTQRRLPPQRVAVEEPDLPFVDERERDGFWGVAVLQTRAALEQFRRVVHPANLAQDPVFVAATRERYAMSRPYMHALAGFARPVTIACGRDDHWVGFEDALKLVRALPLVRYSVLPDCGHLLPLEQPGYFHALLSDWLERL
jgi:pimeloyl-ACP methyl ester carboxylesterase